MSDQPRRDGTRVVHAGLPPAGQGEPFLPGPVFAGPFHHAGEVDPDAYSYNRFGNPTWSAYEQALGGLEDAEAVLFSSGMAALSAALLPLLRSGDVLVAPHDAYPGIRGVATDQLEPAGVEVRMVATADAEVRAALDGATVVWVESPSNPCLDVVDIAALADAAHQAGALLIVDNTLATSLGQRPLDLGADLVVTSASKYMTGHSDLLLGYVTTRDAARADGVRKWRTGAGAIAGPFEAWLAHRSLATLALRLERQCANALALASLLAARDDVAGVRYPGLPGDPSHAVAARQMSSFGALVGFELPSAGAAQRFLAACELVAEATSFGGLHSNAERRGRWGTDAVGDGFIRFSCGIEDPQDLLADVEQALDSAR